VVNLGKHTRQKRRKSYQELRDEVTQMKSAASPDARRFLNVVANWAVGVAGPLNSLRALESLLQELSLAPNAFKKERAGS
jgi:hypothetical protein